MANHRFLGAVLLIAGSCIGAGMLGLPVLSGLTGFVPSVVMFIICWLFMVCTGLLLLEVNLWFKDEASIISMAEVTLGKVGKAFAWATFLFLFYSLNVAYVSGIGSLLTDLTQDLTGLLIEPWMGSLGCILFFGVFTYLGTRAVDQCNRLLMAGLIVSYLALLAVGSRHVNSELLKHSNWSASILVIPAMILSFGFHNLVPSLTYYLKSDRKQLRNAVLLGSGIPLLIYLAWQWLILGLIPVEGENGFMQALDKESLATQALRTAIGCCWVVELAQYFAFFAIMTSFIGVALSFVDFLADGLKIEKKGGGKVFLVALTMLPTFFFALIYPAIFLTALRYAGGFGAVILFGIMPALMVWKGRYQKGMNAHPLLPGGRFSLLLVILFSFIVIGLQLLQEMGLL